MSVRVSERGGCRSSSFWHFSRWSLLTQQPLPYSAAGTMERSPSGRCRSGSTIAVGGTTTAVHISSATSRQSKRRMLIRLLGGPSCRGRSAGVPSMPTSRRFDLRGTASARWSCTSRWMMGRGRPMHSAAGHECPLSRLLGHPTNESFRPVPPPLRSITMDDYAWRVFGRSGSADRNHGTPGGLESAADGGRDRRGFDWFAWCGLFAVRALSAVCSGHVATPVVDLGIGVRGCGS